MDSIDIGQPYSTCEGVEADTETERTHLVRFHRLPNVSCFFHCYRVSKKFQPQIWASLRFILISKAGYTMSQKVVNCRHCRSEPGW